MRSGMKLLLAMAVLGSPASAAPEAPRAPTEKWVVDFDDAQCVASRQYGTAENPLVLALKQPPVGQVMQFVVIRRGSGGRFAEQVNARLSIDGGAPVNTTMIVFGAKDQGRRVLKFNMTLDQFAAVRHGKHLSVDASGELRATFELREIEPLVKIMDECVTGLRAIWNVGEQGESKVKEPASARLQDLFSGQDYPGIAIEKNKSGAVGVVILVDEFGKVADCTVIETSGVASLDAQSCALISQRAKFKPSLGTDGRPMKDAFFQRITWRIE